MMSEIAATSFITTTIEAHLCEAIKNEDKVTVEKLLVEGCDLNAIDMEGNTALHVSCNTGDVPLSLLLLARGAKFDILNQDQNTALHEACIKSLSDVVMMMMDSKLEFEKAVNIINKNGLPPLHISSQLGPANLVRFLVIGGADVEYINKYGKDAEQIAVENKQFEIARLMRELKQSWDYRSNLLNDLKEDNSKIDRISLKVFGNSGVGKTTLIDSLKSGYLKRFFSFSKRKNEINDFFLPELNDDDKAMVRPPLSRYTRGIQVDQCGITDAGKLSIWEFSGFEQYTSHFDIFLHQSSNIFLIVFDIQDDLETIIEQKRFEEDKKNASEATTDHHLENQIPLESINRSIENQPDELHYLDSSKEQVIFWLNFIRATLPLNEPIGINGDCIWKPSVILVGAHVLDDEGRSYLAKSYDEFVQDLKDDFQRDLDIQSDMFLLDARNPGGEPMRKLRSKIGSLKRNLIENMPYSINCLQKALRETKKLSHEVDYLYWNDFVEAIRNTVNSLTLDKHIRTIVHQLQQMGEVIFLEVERDQDIVILKPNWLTTNIIGHLLSFEILDGFHIDGFISNNELSMLFPNEDLFEIKKILQAVDICVEHRLPSDVLYLPSLNFEPSPGDIWDGWNNDENDDDEAYGSQNNDKNNNKKSLNNNDESVKSKYASDREDDSEGEHVEEEKWIGVQLGPFDQDDMVGEIIGLLFPRCVIAIRNATRNRDICPCLVTEIYSWDSAIRMDCENSSTIVKLSPSNDHIDVITRGSYDSTLEMFCFNEFVLSVIFGKLEKMTPGIFICRFSMSPGDLRRTYKNKHDDSSSDDDSSGYDIDLYDNNDSSEDLEYSPTKKSEKSSKKIKKTQKKHKSSYNDNESDDHLAIRVYDSKEILDCVMASKSSSYEDIIKCELNKNLPSDPNTIQEKKTEKLIDVIACGSEVIFKQLVFGCHLHLSVLHIQARMMLAELLDEEVKRNSVVIVEEGRSSKEVEVEESTQQKNWRHLARELQVSDTFQDEKEAEFKRNGEVTLVRASPTDTILALSSYNISSSIVGLCVALKNIGREDARDVVLRSVHSFNLSMSPMQMFQTFGNHKQYNLFENIEFKSSWYSHYNKKPSQIVLEDSSNKNQESFA